MPKGRTPPRHTKPSLKDEVLDLLEQGALVTDAKTWALQQAVPCWLESYGLPWATKGSMSVSVALVHRAFLDWSRRHAQPLQWQQFWGIEDRKIPVPALVLRANKAEAILVADALCGSMELLLLSSPELDPNHLALLAAWRDGGAPQAALLGTLEQSDELQQALEQFADVAGPGGHGALMFAGGGAVNGGGHVRSGDILGARPIRFSLQVLAAAQVSSLSLRPKKKAWNRYCRFLVRLHGTQPSPWRRFELRADQTFWDLHCAIQDACGWTHSHLFQFLSAESEEEVIAECPPEWAEPGEGPDCRGVPLASVFGDGLKRRITYLYDFGDSWLHDVIFECVDELPDKAPRRLLDGEHAFPREDCGGTPGLERCRLAALLDPTKAPLPEDEELTELKEWIGDWHPDHFDLEATRRRFEKKR